MTGTVAGLQGNCIVGTVVEVCREKSVISYKCLRCGWRDDGSDGENVAVHWLNSTCS